MRLMFIPSKVLEDENKFGKTELIFSIIHNEDKIEAYMISFNIIQENEDEKILKLDLYEFPSKDVEDRRIIKSISLNKEEILEKLRDKNMDLKTFLMDYYIEFEFIAPYVNYIHSLIDIVSFPSMWLWVNYMHDMNKEIETKILHMSNVKENEVIS